MVKGIPEVLQTTGLLTGHAEVVAVASEVSLTWEADGDIVGLSGCFIGSAAIVT
jgi:hypothetical protein